MYERKGQSALEFLTTYGWAFLVILIMIGALSYFGVLDPSRFLPDKCLITSGFECGEMGIVTNGTGTGSVNLFVTNSVGKTVNINTTLTDLRVTGSTACTGFQGAALDGADISGTPVTWIAGDESRLVLTCNGALAEGERVEVTFSGSYVPAGGQFAKSIDITMAGRAE